MTKEQKLLDEIYRFGKRALLFELAGKVLYMFLLLLVFWISISLADDAFYFSAVTRWGLLIINITVLVFLGYSFVFKPLNNWMSLTSSSNLTPVAKMLGKTYPMIADKLVNTYQLITKPDKSTSESLRNAAIDNFLKRPENIDFSSKLKLKSYLPGMKLVISILFGASTIIGFHFHDVSRSTLRLLNPSNEYKEIPLYNFNIKPGDVSVEKGNSIEIEADYSGPPLKDLSLVLMAPGGRKIVRSLPMVMENHIYRAALPDVKLPFEYRLEGIPENERQWNDRLISENYSVEVLVPPEISRIDIILTPPAYSGLDKQYIDRNVGDIYALAGTIAEISLETENPVLEGKIYFNAGDSVNLRVRGNHLEGKFSVNKNDRYSIRLKDNQHLSNINPIEYTVKIMPDNPPWVDVVEPGKDIESPLDARIQLKIEASDDYGIGYASLLFRFVRNNDSSADTLWSEIKLNSIDGNRINKEYYYIWDFNALPLTFNDGIKYYALVKDNNVVRGPGLGKSKIYYVRFPSLDELFDSFAKTEQEKVEDLEEVAKKSEDLKKTLEEIHRDLKREQKMDWETKAQLEKTLAEQQKLQKKLEDIRNELEKMIEKLDQNNLISQDVLEKYMELQELFREIATPEMMEAMQELQNALDQSNPNEIQRAMEKFNLNQEAFKQNVERTIELLKQVQLEQKMDQLVQQAKNLSEQQEKIGKALNEEKLNRDAMDQLEAQQEQQEASSDVLERGLEKLARDPSLNRFPELMENLDSAADLLNDPSFNSSMNEMKQNLSQGDQNAASEKSKDLQQTFQQLQQRLSSAKDQMQNKHKNQIMKKMSTTISRMLQLSHEQENLKQQTESASNLGTETQKIAREQGRVLENFQKVIHDIIQLSKETFFIGPELIKPIGNAQSSMHRSLDALSEMRNSQASGQQQQAMAGLNEGIAQMQMAMSQLSNSQSGTGLEQFLEQLQQMAGAQGQINQGSMGLIQGQGNQGQFTPGQQAEMRRLAGQQQALRDALQKMNEETGSRGDVLGRIGELGQQMEEVVKDLLKGNADRKTIERQRQILSRLLDAQKSVQEREYSKQRKAEKAKDYIAKDPREIENQEDKNRKEILDAMRRALNEGYNPDFQKLIEAYFKSLSTAETK